MIGKWESELPQMLGNVGITDFIGFHLRDLPLLSRFHVRPRFFNLNKILVMGHLESAMRLLYKAYGCEKIQGKNVLLPGYPMEATSRPVPPGSKIQVELADGTLLETIALDTNHYDLSESVLSHLRIRGKSGLYYAIQVPDDFAPTAVELGVNVFLLE